MSKAQFIQTVIETLRIYKKKLYQVDDLIKDLEKLK